MLRESLRRRPSVPDEEKKMRPCPFCGQVTEEVQGVCRSCGRAFPKPAVASPTLSNTRSDLRLLAFLALGVMLLGLAGIVVTYLAGEGASSGPQSTSSSTSFERLDAEVRFTGTQFVIRNNGAVLWEDITCEVNRGSFTHGYLLHIDSLRPGDQVTVGALAFAQADGTRFNPFAMKPRTIDVVATVSAGGRRGMWSGSLN